MTVAASHRSRFSSFGDACAFRKRIVNDAYAELIARHPSRFKGFASIPMDAPDAAQAELDRARASSS
jgi:predicted TIM-barrel fold metal-dependent hydrolase